ncbi:MAG: hypothetical protein AAF460_04685 [Pseudomonadota bacterium]
METEDPPSYRRYVLRVLSPIVGAALLIFVAGSEPSGRAWNSLDWSDVVILFLAPMLLSELRHSVLSSWPTAAVCVLASLPVCILGHRVGGVVGLALGLVVGSAVSATWVWVHRRRTAARSANR